MDPDAGNPSPKPKRSFRKALRQGIGNAFKRSPSTSRLASRASSTESRSPSPLPHDQPSLASGSSRTHQTPTVLTPDADPSILPNTKIEAPQIVISSAPIGPSDENKNRDSRLKGGVWARLETALKILQKSTGALPLLQSAIGDAASEREVYNELAAELSSLTELLTQHINQSPAGRMSASIANICRSIEEQARLIENKLGQRAGARVIESAFEVDEIEKSYHQIGSLFRKLYADATLSIWKVVNDQMTETRLEKLMPVRLAAHDSTLSAGISRRTCTPNTRTTILHGLDHWTDDLNAASVYWMNGMAGTGKTTIACSFSESLETRKQLAASFFCAKNIPDCRRVSRIIPTISYQLARYSIPFQSSLCEALCEYPDAGSKNMTKQFEQLLRQPLVKVREAMPNNLVVVIDALDECEDIHEAELLLEILLKSSADIPLKFFVTSRPKPEIYDRMLTSLPHPNRILHLHEVEKSLVQADIELYLMEELKFMSPTSRQIEELAQRSGSLFIYAATLVRSIASRRSQVNPQRWLQSMLATTVQSTKQYAQIDGLYAAILEAALDTNSEYYEAEEIEDVRQVLWTVICTQVPISSEVLAVLSGLADEARVMNALQPLRAVINISENTQLISTLHVSFSDFMFDKNRSKAFYCDVLDRNEIQARRCFEVMKTQLRFNICGLQSSFVPDSDLANVDDRAKKSISPSLLYACRFWADHLRHSTYSNSLGTVLTDFLTNGLLFWMEVLNLNREIGLSAAALLKAKLWIPIEVLSLGLTKMIEDARNFATSLSISAVSQCTPHIYLSLLPFCPRSSAVFHHYGTKVWGFLDVTGPALQKRDTGALACWKVGSNIPAIAYSPDGMNVAFSCADNTLRVWSAQDATPIDNFFRGHNGNICSLAYSPHGTSIASGSGDRTVRVWGVYDTTLDAGPFEGHTDLVASVVFSPDARHIASGSYDKTIRVWDVFNGTTLTKPFEGHTGRVHSIAYSPDGTCIVSGSDDRTVRVWNAQDGTPVNKPFEGHADWVTSVAYSPDGTRIISGSSDKTIRVWDVHSDRLIAGPFEVDSPSLRSVVGSPDGTLIAAACDTAIKVWDAYTGELVTGPLEGHTSFINSIAYSPDGTRIASGASDGTVRIWDARQIVHGSVAPSRQLQASAIMSISHSPSGGHIASGSVDGVVGVWNAHDGALVTTLLNDETVNLSSIAYSPDGTRLASGSSTDNIIRIWDISNIITTSTPVLLESHTRPILSIAYSPHGNHIASSSADRTIHIQDTSDGTIISKVLNKHTSPVLSVAYSPDGMRIASGSRDTTIRIWSAVTGEHLTGPFSGHTSWVASVAYSPDGAHVASGSDDKTVRLWDAHNGKSIMSPFHGHTDSVLSVAFSPDGTQIVSGSRDQTIRVWNAQDGTVYAGPFEGHCFDVSSVTYSPNGTSIISGSMDGSIRVWNIWEGAPFTSPSSIVSSTTSSPSLPTPLNSSPNPARKIHPLLRHWTIRPDGWVVNGNLRLFWVPSDLANYLPTIYNPFVITPSGFLKIEFNDAVLGENWHRCYKP